MPAKKKTKKAVKKKAAKRKDAGKAASKKTAKKKARKAPAKEKSPEKKAVKAAAAEDIPAVDKSPQPKPEIKKPPAKPQKEKLGIDCEHCEGTGVCAAGTPYDKSHGQMFGVRLRMTSCVECLLAAGEHRNSKKLVECRICGGDGKV
jgi:hypothetical protein